MGDGGVPIRAPTTGDQCLGGGGMVDVHVMCEGGGQGAGRESWGHEPGRGYGVMGQVGGYGAMGQAGGCQGVRPGMRLRGHGPR